MTKTNNAITYQVRDDDGIETLHRMSYTPTLEDAKQWKGETEQFVYVCDLLGLSLVWDGDRYVDGKVNKVERAYNTLLGK
jgi:hypothetical protein